MSEPNLDYYAATQEEADQVNNNLFACDIRQCERCPLHKERNVACPGWFLSLPLDILFVGMSPGKDEDKAGRPFIGRAGKKLMELADSINLIKSDTMIGFTNVVRCHTPDNRPPTGQEIQACSTWMRAELDMAEPKVVMLLGNSAIPLAFENKKIGQVAGSARAMGSTIYIACYHPAAILHKRSAVIQDSIVQSMKLAKEVLHENRCHD